MRVSRRHVGAPATSLVANTALLMGLACRRAEPPTPEPAARSVIAEFALSAPAPTPTTEAATLARTLRSSVGCDFPQRLTPDECEACAARTAEGVKTAPFIPVPIARTCGPITALAELKVPEKPLARASATNIDIRGVKDSLGGFDCGIPLAPRGCKLRGPPNSLWLGCLPFFIVPPESPLTQGSSLRHPNTLLKSEKQRHHRVLLGLRPALTATRSMTG